MTNSHNNKTVYMVVALVVFLLAAAYFYMKKSPSPAPQAANDAMMAKDTTTDDNTDPSLIESGKNTLMGLMSMGKDLQCTFAYATEGKAPSKGTMYISGKKMRGHFDNEINGKASTMHMIQDGTYMYIWGSELPEGIKMMVPQLTPGATGDTPTANTGANQYFDANQQVDFSCNPWSVDESQFVPPANVMFRDMAAMMKGLPGSNQ